MSLLKTTDIACDGDDCQAWVHGESGARPQATRARANAKLYGWRHTADGRDLCPDHQGGTA